MQKEVELYLQMCGKPHMGTDTFRTIRPGDICWLLVQRHWATLECFAQTVTLNGNFLILEVWHDSGNSSNSEAQELLSVNADLKTLHTALANNAERCCRKYIESLVSANYSANYWEPGLATIEAIKQLRTFKAQNRATELTNWLKLDTERLKEAIATQAPIEKLIELSDISDKMSEGLNQVLQW